MNNETNKQKSILVLCILSGIIVIFAVFMLLKMIWSSDNTTTKTEEKVISSAVEGGVGTYKSITYTQEKQVQRYASSILASLLASNTKNLYGQLDSGYIKYYDMTEEKLKEQMTSKGIYGKELKVSKYELINYKKKKYFKIHVSNMTNTINTSFMIIETSPNNYTLAFDDFMFYHETGKEYLNEDIKMTIRSELGIVNKYTLNVTLENTSKSEIILNKANNYEIFYLRLSNGTDKRIESTVLAGESVSFVPNQKLNYTFEYTLSALEFQSIKSQIIKEVTLTKINKTQEISFDL